MAVFLYGDGVNPFGSDDGSSPNKSLVGNGIAKGVVRDAFDPEYERPWVGLPG